MSDLENRLRSLSRDINIAKEKGIFRIQINSFLQEYIDCISKLEPFCPATVKLVRKDLNLE